MKKIFVLLIVLAGFLVSAFCDEPAKEEKPLWEAGLFNGAVRYPDYRGSDEYTAYILPLPYFIYRGELIRINREGVKGIFWSNDRIETALSLSGWPPVNKDNKARQGMPEIGAIAEIGPGIKIFIREREAEDPLYIKAGVRAAVSADNDLSVAYRGLRGDAKLVYRNRTWLKDQKIKLGLAAGVSFANRAYTDFLYGVDPIYATATRPAYSADGGYAGFNASAYAVKKLNDRWLVRAYYRWDNLSGTAFADSPLVKTENNHIVGIALTWRIFESDKTSRYQSD